MAKGVVMQEGYSIRLKNRNVAMWRVDDGGYLMRFKRLRENWRDMDKGKRIKYTQLRLSKEAMCAVIRLWQDLEVDFNVSQRDKGENDA